MLPIEAPSILYHFGFSSSANSTKESYKILQVEKIADEKCRFMIYTLGSDTSWRHIENNEVSEALPFDAKSRPFADGSSSVCVDGVIYWTQRTTSSPVPQEAPLIRCMEFETTETVIVAFDVEQEKFRVIPPPRVCSCNNIAILFNKIVELCGCVALMYVNEYEQKIDLMILKDSQNHWWEKQMIRVPFGVMALGRRALYRTLTRGKFVFFRGENMIYFYNMETKTLEGSQIILPPQIRRIREGLRMVEMYDDTIFPLK